MELNITNMMKDADEMQYLSGSVAELGVRAGALTWENSQRYSKSHPLLKPDQIEEAKDYFAGYGAWSDSEIDAWTESDVQALVTQEVAAKIREYLDYNNYADYQLAAEQGSASGRIYLSDTGEWLFFLGF
jgi:hypothetical protein